MISNEWEAVWLVLVILSLSTLHFGTRTRYVNWPLRIGVALAALAVVAVIFAG